MITHVFEDVNTGYSITTTVMSKNKLLDEGIIALLRILGAMALVYTTQDYAHSAFDVITQDPNGL